MREANKDDIKTMKKTPVSDGTIDLTASQALVLNFLMPARFKIDFSDNKNIRSRKPELEAAVVIPSKRAVREKEPEFLSGQSESFKKCYRFLQALKQNPLSRRFLTIASNTNNDEDSEHIDISTIENKFISGEYLSSYHILKDIRKMVSISFQNCTKNPENFREIFQFSQMFESSFKAHENLVFSDSIVQDLNKKIERLSEKIKDFQSRVPQTKNVKDKKMNNLEKKQLCQSLRKLEPKYLNGVLKIVKGCMNIQGSEMEFDLEKLPDKVCRELDRYIKQCLQIKSVKKKNTSEMTKPAVLTSSSKVEPEPQSDSSESSSSSSESVDEMPGPLYPDLWDRDVHDFNSAISIDFDKD